MRCKISFHDCHDQWGRPRVRIHIQFPRRPALSVRVRIGPKKNGGAGFRWWGDRKEEGGGHWWAFSTYERINLVRELEQMEIPEDREVTTEKPKRSKHEHKN